jgi:hypothetical protein
MIAVEMENALMAFASAMKDSLGIIAIKKSVRLIVPIEDCVKMVNVFA